MSENVKCVNSPAGDSGSASGASDLEEKMRRAVVGIAKARDLDLFALGLQFGLTYSENAPGPLSSAWAPWLQGVQDLAVDCVSAQVEVVGHGEREAIRQGVLAGVVDGCAGRKDATIRPNDRISAPVSSDDSDSPRPVGRKVPGEDGAGAGSARVLRLDSARQKDSRSTEDTQAESGRVEERSGCGDSSLVARLVDLGRVTREFTEEVSRDRPRPALRLALEVEWRVALSDALAALESLDMWTEGGDQ